MDNINLEAMANLFRGNSLNLKPLKRTDPQSFRAWRRYVTFAATENRWNDRQAITKAYGAIQNRAEALAARVPPNLPAPDSGEAVPTFQSYLDRLQAVFIPDSNQRLANQALRSAKQKAREMPNAWGQRLYDLHTDAFPDMTAQEREEDRTLIDRFIDGLIDMGMNLTLQRSNPDTFQEAINMALQERNTVLSCARSKGHETMARLARERPGLVIDHKRQRSPSSSSSDDDRGDVMALQQKRPRYQNNRRFQGNGRPRPAQQGGLRCFMCQKQGHRFRECPQRRRDRRNRFQTNQRVPKTMKQMFQQSVNAIADSANSLFELTGQDSGQGEIMAIQASMQDQLAQLADGFSDMEEETEQQDTQEN